MATKQIQQEIASNAKAIAIQVAMPKKPAQTELNFNTEALTALASEQNVIINGSDKRQFGYSFVEGTDANVAGSQKLYGTDKIIATTTDKEIYGATETYTVTYQTEEE